MVGAWQFTDLTPPDSPPEISCLVSYVFRSQGTQHFIYAAAKSPYGEGDWYTPSINELWADAQGWHHADLTAITGAPGGFPTAGYAFEAQGTQHLIYTVVDDPAAPEGQGTSIHELWWDITGWHHNNLSAAGAPPALAVTTAFALDATGTQHLVYVGSDSHLHEFWWDSGGWHHRNLSALTGAPTGGWFLNNAPPIAYRFDAQGTTHVVYCSGTDNHIYELWLDSSGWHLNDLTKAAGAPPADAFGGLAGYAFDAQNTQHVIYTGQLAGGGGDGSLHELWWDVTGWHYNNLTTAVGAPKNYYGSTGLTGYASDMQYTQHVAYVGSDLHLHEFWWDTSGWHHTDLTVLTGAPDAPNWDFSPRGYAFDAQDSQHITYIGRVRQPGSQPWGGGGRIYDFAKDTRPVVLAPPPHPPLPPYPPWRIPPPPTRIRRP